MHIFKQEKKRIIREQQRRGKLLVFGGSLLPGATSLTLAANGRTRQARQERPTQSYDCRPPRQSYISGISAPAGKNSRKISAIVPLHFCTERRIKIVSAAESFASYDSSTNGGTNSATEINRFPVASGLG